MKYYVYALCEPDSRTIRYIGVSTSPIRRRYQHISVSKKGSSSPLCNWLRSLSKKPNLIVLRETSETEWQEDERLFISNARMLGMALVNSTDGGKGGHPIPSLKAKFTLLNQGKNLGRKSSVSTRLLLRAAKLGKKNYNFGKTASPETRAKQSAVKMGLMIAPEILARRIGKKRGPYKKRIILDRS